MNYLTLKDYRRRFPALLIGLYFVVFSTSFGQDFMLQYLPFGLAVSIILGGMYETLRCRDNLFKSDYRAVRDHSLSSFKDILDNLKLDRSMINDDDELLDLLWSIIDNNKTITESANKVRVNSLYLSSFQDTIIISSFAEIVSVVLLFTKGDEYVWYVLGFLIILIISFLSKDLSLKNHLKLITRQQKNIGLHLRLNPVSEINSLLSSLQLNRNTNIKH